VGERLETQPITPRMNLNGRRMGDLYSPGSVSSPITKASRVIELP